MKQNSALPEAMADGTEWWESPLLATRAEAGADVWLPGDGAALLDDSPPAGDALGFRIVPILETGAEVGTEAAATAVKARVLEDAGSAAAAAWTPGDWWEESPP